MCLPVSFEIWVSDHGLTKIISAPIFCAYFSVALGKFLPFKSWYFTVPFKDGFKILNVSSRALFSVQSEPMFFSNVTRWILALAVLAKRIIKSIFLSGTNERTGTTMSFIFEFADPFVTVSTGQSVNFASSLGKTVLEKEKSRGALCL